MVVRPPGLNPPDPLIRMNFEHRRTTVREPDITMRASRAVLIRDALIFGAKLALDGLKDVVLIWLSLGAVIFDLFFGGKRRRLFYQVMRLGEKFDLWLNLHGALTKGEDTGDGLFGGSKAGSDTLVGQIEQIVRGGDEPRGGRRRDEV